MFVAALFFLSPPSVNAQIRVSINFTQQPQWGPAEYDYVEYYYLPEYDVYYYVPDQQFVYLSGTRWVFSNSLPYRYRNVDLYTTYKVVINDQKPYMRHDYYSDHYKKYKYSHAGQGSIRDSKNEKYHRGNSHPGNEGKGKYINSRDRNEHRSVGNEPRKKNQGNREPNGNESRKKNQGNKEPNRKHRK